MTVTRELCVDVPARRRAAAVAAVRGLGVMGLQLRDRASGAPPGRVQVLVWLPPTEATVRSARALADALGPDATVTWQDRVTTWDASPARPLGRRFVVIGADDAPVDPTGEGRIPLALDAALAFGDGLHPTTALCVEALEQALEALDGPRPSLLDVGTGTGVLALVAAHLGAAPVVAQDVDPLAVWAARRAAARSGAAIGVHETLPDGRFDLVVANLYLAPLLALLPALAERRAASGALLVSGFVEAALPEVRDGLARVGLRAAATTARDGWCAVLARAA